MLVMEKGTDDYIYIWITIWIRDFFGGFSAIVSPSALLLLDYEASDVLTV